MLDAMLDTNVCIRAMRSGGEAVCEWLILQSEQLCLSTVVLHELYVGAELSARPARHFGLIDSLVANLTLLEFDAAAARHAASIRADLQRRGALIGSNDMLIAGHARSKGYRLITSDLADFRRVDGLRCEDWMRQEG